MTMLTSLSSEVIDIILSYSDISFEDIVNFRCVCKQFRLAAKTEQYCFHKKKYSQRWFSAKKYYDEQSKKNSKQKEIEETEQQECLGFIETGIDCVRQLRKYMSTLNFNILLEHEEGGIPRTTHYYYYMREYLRKKITENTKNTENFIKIVFFIDEFKHLFTQPLRVGCDLTERRRYLTLYNFLKINWRNFILQRFDKQSYKEFLEQSATILAQQLQFEKYVSYSSVKASLNTIALEVLNFLREKHPEHSIFSTSDAYFAYWENNNINDNYWSEAEGTQIMDTLEEYMFGKLNFRSVDVRQLDYICIDYVLENKCGQDIIIYIIYESVARRLGLRCDIVTSTFPSLSCSSYYFQLFWMPRYTFTANNRENIYDLVDEENRKNVRNFAINFELYFPHCITRTDSNYREKIYKRTFAEILEIMCPIGRDFLCYDNEESSDYFQIVKSYDMMKRYYVPATRPQDVKFAVGMIVRHGDESTDCSTGVIIGWHQNYFNNTIGPSIRMTSDFITPWRRCSNISIEQRTYYIILTKSVKLCHVEEDAITLTKPSWIENVNIYYYFSKFEGTHYVPNRMVAAVYPHDAAITAKTLFKN